MILNKDPATGYAYGYIAANSLIEEIVEKLFYGPQAKNLSEAEAVDAEIARQRAEWEEECEIKSVAAQEAGTDCVLDDFEANLDHFESMVEEPVIEGEYEGIAYRTSWLGGALNFAIIRSPIVGRFDQCSPCLPGAGNLDSRNSDGMLTFDVAPDWRVVDESASEFRSDLGGGA